MTNAHGTLGLLTLSALLLGACGGGGGGAGPEIGGGDPTPPDPGSSGPPSEAFAMQVDGALPQLVRGGAVEVPLTIDLRTNPDPVTLSLPEVDPSLSAVVGTNGSGQSFVRVDAPSQLDEGRYDVVVRGVRGQARQDLRLSMEMPQSSLDFSLVAPLQMLDLSVGEQGSLSLRVEPGSGSAPSVDWTLDGAPPGLDVSVVGAELVVDATASAPVGSHDVTATARAEGVERSVSFLLRVRPEPVVDGLTLDLPPMIRVRQGASVDAQLSLLRETGVIGNVDLTAVTEPSASLSTVIADAPLGLATTTVTVTAAVDAPLGESLMTITAQNGLDRAEDTVLVQVVPLGTPDLHFQRVEFAQSFFATDPILVGDKDTVLRAHVISDQLATPAPVVRVEGFDAGLSLGTLDLSGPAVLPTGCVPGDLSQSFTVTLPSAWIRPGLECRVMIDPDDVVVDLDERNDVHSVEPRVGPSQGLRMVVVPLILNGRSPTIPNNYRVSLEAMWPLSNVDLTVRAPYTVTSVTDLSSNGDGWSSVLSELRTLRSTEGSSAYYYGVCNTTYSSGTAGIGYVGLPVGLGWDRSSSSTDVMLHELGHNFGLRHAPCGGPSNPDANYPYSSGRIGTYGYDRRSGALVDRRSGRDVMTYCGPEWVSDYNHDKVRERLSGSLLVATAVVPQALGNDFPLWTLGGVVEGDGSVTIDAAGPVQSVGALPAAAAPLSASHWLRVETVSGAVIERGLDLLDVGCLETEGARHFSVTLVDPGMLASWSIVDAEGRVLAGKTASPVAFSGAGHSSVVEERNGVLSLSWNAQAVPQVSVVHLGERRTAIGLALKGGSASLSTVGLPAGGSFELQWSDGLNTWTEVRGR